MVCTERHGPVYGVPRPPDLRHWQPHLRGSEAGRRRRQGVYNHGQKCLGDEQVHPVRHLNGKPLNKPWFEHKDLASGGTLVFEMGPRPNNAWGSAPEAAAQSFSQEILAPSKA